jgi:hypothetical protein
VDGLLDLQATLDICFLLEQFSFHFCHVVGVTGCNLKHPLVKALFLGEHAIHDLIKHSAAILSLDLVGDFLVKREFVIIFIFFLNMTVRVRLNCAVLTVRRLLTDSIQVQVRSFLRLLLARHRQQIFNGEGRLTLSFVEEVLLTVVQDDVFELRHPGFQVRIRRVNPLHHHPILADDLNNRPQHILHE